MINIANAIINAIPSVSFPDLIALAPFPSTIFKNVK